MLRRSHGHTGEGVRRVNVAGVIESLLAHAERGSNEQQYAGVARVHGNRRWNPAKRLADASGREQPEAGHRLDTRLQCKLLPPGPSTSWSSIGRAQLRACRWEHARARFWYLAGAERGQTVLGRSCLGASGGVASRPRGM